MLLHTQANPYKLTAYTPITLIIACYLYIGKKIYYIPFIAGGTDLVVQKVHTSEKGPSPASLTACILKE